MQAIIGKVYTCSAVRLALFYEAPQKRSSQKAVGQITAMGLLTLKRGVFDMNPLRMLDVYISLSSLWKEKAYLLLCFLERAALLKRASRTARIFLSKAYSGLRSLMTMLILLTFLPPDSVGLLSWIAVRARSDFWTMTLSVCVRTRKECIFQLWRSGILQTA